MTYLRNFVICTFRALHPDDLDVSDQDLEDFDKSLKIEFDAEVRKQADANGIAKTTFNLSMLVFLSAMSTAGTASRQAKEGRMFFNAVKPLP